MNNEMCGCAAEEKTPSAKGIVRINYKEDFELVVELLAGDNPYTLGDEDFRIDFMVMASRYTVGRTDGVCERCMVVDGNKIRCFMDGHGLPPGELRAEVKVDTPDVNYADGKRLSVAIAEGVVLLVKDNTRFDGAVIKANIPVVLVDAYQLAKAHGYNGTIDEYYSTFSDVSALLESVRGMAEEERKRSTAETERAKEEKQRNDTEVLRNKNEQQRQTNEDARNKAETERQKAEKERTTAEGKRETDTQAAIERVNERMKTLRDGNDGKSAYESWKAQGNSGTEADFVSSLGNAMKIVTHEETETAVTLRPFEEHRWRGKPKMLDITMEKPQQGELAAEYRLCFNTPDDAATTVALPNNVQFTIEPAFRFGCYYELSLVYNDNEYKGLFAEWRRKL